MSSPIQVLYIETDPSDFGQTTTYFDQQAPHINLTLATSFSAAKERLSNSPFDSIVLDYLLPDGTGLDFLRHLQAISSKTVPIFLMEIGNYVQLSEVLDQGGFFHVVKGIRYWECLPSMIAQAVEYSRRIEKERTMHTELELVVDSLTVKLEICERALKEAQHRQAQALPADHLAHARDEFMSRVSHEFKTPLTAVLGFAHMMVTRPDAPVEKRQKWAFFIESKSEQLNRLVDNMLDLSDLQAGYLVLKKSNADISALIHRAVEEMEAIAPERRFQLDIPADLPEVNLDADRISQVILNMLSNAHNSSPDDQSVEVSVRSSDDQLEMRVVDHGVSLDPIDRERVFEPFSAEPGAGYQPGKGLWLPLARTLIEAHGGHLWIEPTPDHGSTFVFSLPLA
jgi:signal transduction histidine kinase